MKRDSSLRCSRQVARVEQVLREAVVVDGGQAEVVGHLAAAAVARDAWAQKPQRLHPLRQPIPLP